MNLEATNSDSEQIEVDSFENDEYLKVLQGLGVNEDSIDKLGVNQVASLIERVRDIIQESDASQKILHVWNYLEDKDKIALYKAGSPKGMALSRLMPILNMKYRNMFLKMGFGDTFAPIARSLVMIGLIDLPSESGIDVHEDAKSDKKSTELVFKLLGYVPQLAKYKVHLQLLSKLNSKLHDAKIEVARKTQMRAA